VFTVVDNGNTKKVKINGLSNRGTLANDMKFTKNPSVFYLCFQQLLFYTHEIRIENNAARMKLSFEKC